MILVQGALKYSLEKCICRLSQLRIQTVMPVTNAGETDSVKIEKKATVGWQGNCSG